jgi:hypothetical protein
MLLQTNSYVVPRDKRSEHARILRRFRQALIRLGCDHFEVFEQVGPNWNGADTTGRFVQIMRFRDRKHQMFVQAAERNDPTCQELLREFCELINVSYQQQQGLFAVGFYSSFLRMPPQPQGAAPAESTTAQSDQGNHQDQADASGPTGVLSMSKPPEESAPGDAVAPAAEPRQEDEAPPQDAPADDSSDDRPNAIDLNAESPETTGDASAEAADQDAFLMLPENDLPQPGDSAQDSSDIRDEADEDPNADLNGGADQVEGGADLDGNAEAENRSTPHNS